MTTSGTASISVVNPNSRDGYSGGFELAPDFQHRPRRLSGDLNGEIRSAIPGIDLAHAGKP
jgi:hypothetical protein